jgi:NADPH:quinone reductase-like Zn-dependent oxidoreductase
MLPRDAGRPNYLKLAVDFLRTPRFSPLKLTNQSKSVMAFNLSYLFERKDLLSDGLGEVMELLKAGTIQAPPATEYAFADVAQAHKDIQSGNTTGKLVLVV